MIYLYAPMVTNKKNIGGCSVFNRMSRMFSKMLEEDESLYILWLGYSGIDYESHFKHPRVLYIKVADFDLFRGQFRWSSHVNSLWFEHIAPDKDASLYYDAIISDLGRSSNYAAGSRRYANTRFSH